MRTRSLEHSRQGFEFWLVVLILAAHLVLALVPANSLLGGWYSSDDAFYYFKAAQNTVSGQGITFDGISRTNGFHPLWMLVCLPLFVFAQFDLVLPLRLIVIVSGGLTAVSSLLLYRLLKRWLPSLLNAAVAIFWAFYPFLHQNITRQGMETSLSVFCTILTLYLLSQLETKRDEKGFAPRSVFWVGLSAALMVLSRLDNIFLAGMIGVWLLWRSPTWRSAPHALRFFLPLDLILALLAVPFAILLRTTGIVPGFVLAIPAIMALEVVIRPAINTLAGLYTSGTVNRRILFLRAGCAALAGSLLVSGAAFVLSKVIPAIQFPRSLPLIEGVVVFTGMTAFRFYTPKGQNAQPKLDWRAFLKTATAYALPLILLIGGYMAFNYFYFGTFTPVSGQIKQWWGTLPVTIYGRILEPAIPVLRMFPVLISNAWSLIGGLWPGGLIVLAALLVILWQRSTMSQALIATGFWPLLGGIWLHVVYYQIIGYLHTRLWYWSNESLWIVLLVALAAGVLTQKIAPTWIGKSLAALLIVGTIGLWIINVVQRLPFTASVSHAELSYQSEAHWLEQNTPPGALIGMTGGGVDAYFIKDRTIVNLDGLMNSVEYFQMLKSGSAAQYLDRIGLDYVFGKPYILLETDPYRGIFTGRLITLGAGAEMTLYQYSEK